MHSGGLATDVKKGSVEERLVSTSVISIDVIMLDYGGLREWGCHASCAKCVVNDRFCCVPLLHLGQQKFRDPR